MKTTTQRPSVWNVIVTLFALVYLSGVAHVLNGARALFNQSGLPATGAVVASGVSTFVGALIVFTWLYLLRDLVRQVALFFKSNAR